MKTSVSEHAFFRLISPELKKLEEVVLQELQHYDPKLVQAATHLMRAGGKRLRPVMVLLSAQACSMAQGADFQGHAHNSHQILAMAVEILHTATLIHDDIIDGSALRRGLPTVNEKWGLRTSVLTGDFLLARACYYISVIEKVRLNTIFSQMVMDMCNGEMSQLERRYKSTISYEEYLEQVRSKTALLMAIGCQGAAIINGASAEVEMALYHYGHDVGIAFQIMDDILDYVVAEGEMGKSARNDLAQGQVTLPCYFALRHSPQATELAAIIERKMSETEDLERALEIVINSDAITRCQQAAQEYIDKAKAHLACLPDSEARQALVELAEFAIQRSK